MIKWLNIIVINDYLNNKKEFFKKKSNDNEVTKQLKLSPKSKVDINKLLNRVKVDKKKKKKRKFSNYWFGWVCYYNYWYYFSSLR